MSTPTPVLPIDDEKVPKLHDHDLKAEPAITEDDRRDSTSKEDVSSLEGDDALKLVGTHAHRFDEKYYRRLRLKIVRLRSSYASDKDNR